MADGDVLVLTGGHQSFSAGSAVLSNLPRLAVSASDVLFSSGTVVLSGLGAATVNTAAGSIRISVPVQSAQTFVGGIAMNAATTYTSGTVVLSAGANITLGSAGQTITISGNAAQSSVTFANSNGVSFGLNGSTVTASVAPDAAQTNQTEGWYGLSQTTGGASSTTFDARTISVNAYGDLSVGFSAGSLQLSAAKQLGALSASNNLYSTGTVVLSGANGITVGTNAQTINISAEGLISSYFHNSAALIGLSAGVAANNATATIIRFPLPHAITFTRMDMPISFSTASSATAATAAVAMTGLAAIYTANGATLSPLIGAIGSSTFSWVSNSGIASSVTGARILSWALATSLSAGDYYIGLNISTTSGISTGAATTALNATIFPLIGTLAASATQVVFGDMNAATAFSSNILFPLQGAISSGVTATSQTLQQSQITGTGAHLNRAQIPLVFRN